MSHIICHYISTEGRVISTWCSNAKHTRCRGVELRRIGEHWYHPRTPRTLAELAEVARLSVAVPPWLFIAAVSLGLSTAAAVGVVTTAAVFL